MAINFTEKAVKYQPVPPPYGRLRLTLDAIPSPVTADAVDEISTRAQRTIEQLNSRRQASEQQLAGWLDAHVQAQAPGYHAQVLLQPTRVEKPPPPTD